MAYSKAPGFAQKNNKINAFHSTQKSEDIITVLLFHIDNQLGKVQLLMLAIAI